MILIDAVPTVSRDCRVTRRTELAKIRAVYIVVKDILRIVQALKSSTIAADSIKISGGQPNQLTKPFFESCKAFVDKCLAENLPKLAVEVLCCMPRSLDHTFRIVTLRRLMSRRQEVMLIHPKAMVEAAAELCRQKFENADQLLEAVNEAAKMLRKELYEAVTTEEIASIKAAMVSGPGGISTNSGH